MFGARFITTRSGGIARAVDLSVHVTASAAVYARCPDYFTKTAGAVKADGVSLEQPDHN